MTTLKSLREENKKTLAEVASVLKIAVSTLSNYEQGIRTIDLRLVIPLAKLFNVAAEDIIEAQLNSIAFRSPD